MRYSKVKRVRYYRDMMKEEVNLGVFKVVGIKKNGKNRISELVYLNKKDELKGKKYSGTIDIDDFKIWRKDEYKNGELKKISKIDYELS